jgi:hypothetical protein
MIRGVATVSHSRRAMNRSNVGDLASRAAAARIPAVSIG